MRMKRAAHSEEALCRSRAEPAVVLLTLAMFVTLLAGDTGLVDVGIQNPFPFPERTAAVLGLLVAGVVLGGVANRRADPKVPLHLPLTVAPLLYLALASYWAPMLADTGPAVLDLLTVVGFCLLAAMLLAWDGPGVLRTMMWCLLISGLVFSLVGLAGATAGSRVSAFGGGPNVYSRVTVLGLVGLVWLVHNRRLPGWAMSAAPVLVGATVVSGSRGGMLACAIVALVLAPLVLGMGRQRLAAGAFLAAIVAAIAFRSVGDSITETVQGRVVELTFNQGYTAGRGPLIDAGLKLFEENVLVGAGLRSYAGSVGGGFTYPHNLLVQIGAETGLVGILLVTAFLARFIREAVRERGCADVRCWAAGAVVILTSAMFSGDYYDSRFLWIFALGTLAAAGSVSATAQRRLVNESGAVSTASRN